MFSLKHMGIVLLAAALLWPAGATAENAPDLNQILKGIEQYYGGKSFKTSFFQESMLKALQISDTVEGYLIVQPPGKMRWEYTVPEPQSIITDGHTMWIYRPTDKQVMVGKAPELFGGGKGAGFLSDVGQIRKSFSVQLEPSKEQQYYRLKLVPRKNTPDLTDLILSVSKNSFRIEQVVTHNAYGDETRIALSNLQFDVPTSASMFTFNPPKGVEVVQVDKF